MNVAFWSNTRGAGVTSSVAVLSTATVIGYPWKVTVFENHYNMDNLAKCFLGYGREAMLHETSGAYRTSCIADDFIRQMSFRMNRRLIDSSAMEIIEDSLYYIWQDSIVSMELFEYEFYYKLYSLLEQTANFSNICFIDTANNNNMSTKEIIEKSEMVVVCLRQDKNQIEGFFENYGSIKNKALFVISDYRRNNPVNIKFIAETYEIPVNRIGCIPHSTGLKEAMDHGRTVEFMNRNFNVKRETPYYIFMKAVKRMSYILISSILELSSGACWEV